MAFNLQHICFVGAESGALQRRAGAGATVRAVGAYSPGRTLAEDGEAGRIDPVTDWVLRSAGLNPGVYRARTLERRLASCRRQLGTNSLEDARANVEREPKRLDAALNALLIGVTEFFRDHRVFDGLRQAVLPELLRDRPGLRVYAPGVSTGHELYSVAMLLAEIGVLARSELVGVDCRADAIASARAGIYSGDALAAVPPSWRLRYFMPLSGGWQARPRLSLSVHFEVGDLFRYTDHGPWDLVLFRNVSIYFEARHAVRAWESLCAQLAPGGFIVVGKAEKPPAHLPLERVASSIYRRMQE